MSDELLNIVVPAILALLGTVLGLWLGHRRWSSEMRLKKHHGFDSSRYGAYQELWAVVENAHITIRTGRPELSEVETLHQQINMFRMRNAILLDAADSELAGKYFESVVNLSTQIAEAGSRPLERRFSKTDFIEPEILARIGELSKTQDETSRLRNYLIARVKAVMLETSYAAGKPHLVKKIEES